MDQAMAFILSDACESYCLELGINYETICEKAVGTVPENHSER
jgi:hypothetical protein